MRRASRARKTTATTSAGLTSGRVMEVIADESSNSRYGSAAAYALILFLYVFVFAVAFLKITNTDISGNDEARRKRNERKLPVSAFFKRSGSSTPASQTATERSQQA